MRTHHCALRLTVTGGELLTRQFRLLVEGLEEAPEGLSELIDEVSSLAESMIQWREVKFRDPAARPAGELPIRLELTEDAARLVAAVAAADGDARVIEDALRHFLAAPVGGLDPVTVTATAGGVTSPLPGSPGGVRPEAAA